METFHFAVAVFGKRTKRELLFGQMAVKIQNVYRSGPQTFSTPLSLQGFLGALVHIVARYVECHVFCHPKAPNFSICSIIISSTQTRRSNNIELNTNYLIDLVVCYFKTPRYLTLAHNTKLRFFFYLSPYKIIPLDCVLSYRTRKKKNNTFHRLYTIVLCVFNKIFN